MKAEVRTDKVYRTDGPYVQAVEARAGKTLYTSGYLGRDTAGELVSKSDAAAQTRQCIDNIRLSIEAAGGSLSDLVRLNVAISHPRHYEAMNAVRKEMLDGIPFTSVTIVAQLIDPHGLVEMDAIAAIGTRECGLARADQARAEDRDHRGGFLDAEEAAAVLGHAHLASATCRAPASPRNCVTSSWIWIAPVAPIGCPLEPGRPKC